MRKTGDGLMSKVVSGSEVIRRKWVSGISLFLPLVIILGCSKKKEEEAGTGSGTSFSVTGKATYDWVPAKDNVTEGGIRLEYTEKAPRPIRRAVVQAVTSSGTVVDTTSTDDLGNYTLSSIPSGSSVYIRVLAKSTVTNYSPDSTAPNYCNGSSWDMRVVDNYTNNSTSQTDPSLRSQYAVTDSTLQSAAATGVNLHASITYTSGYTSRAAAPFALLDTVITEIELVCQSENNTTFPKLYINWSENNISSSGNKYAGQIDTSHYTLEDHVGENSVGNLYILGKENVDTDEYDDHVIGHEFGHYLESKLYRSDSIGGSHSLGDSLDPRVAFGEGYGNALSAMTFNDPVYVDTSGTGQGTGSVINMGTAPTGDNVGIYSETAVQYFLWNLYDGRDAVANSGSYDRIHNIMRNFQKTTSVFTTVTSFSAYYLQQYGTTAEGLDPLFLNTFDVGVDALCSGTCPSSGATADLIDSDFDLAASYGSAGGHPKNYRQTTGTTFSANFWKLYYPLNSGLNNDANHMQVNAGGYTSSYTNKYGLHRWFYYKVPTNTTSLKFVATTNACTTDNIDLIVYKKGLL